MDKDFIQYVYARIEKALAENTEYEELKRKCADASNNDTDLYGDLSCELQAKAEELCYIKGFNDATALLLKQKCSGLIPI